MKWTTIIIGRGIKLEVKMHADNPSVYLRSLVKQNQPKLVICTRKKIKENGNWC